MTPKRIYVNLAAFTLLFLALAAWAVTNVIKLDRIENPYQVTAYFQDAPGLRRNVEVSYLGVSVGHVTTVRLASGAAEVHLAIDRGRHLPTGINAAVRRRSAVGEPYVALTAPSGWHPGDAYLPEDGSYVIPQSATSLPVSYGDLFASADKLLSAVDPHSLHVITSELAIALGGRGDELRTIIGRGADITTTLASNANDLDQLATQLTQLTGVVADKSATIATSTDDLAVLVNSLAASADDMSALLARGPKLGDQVGSLLATTDNQLRCGLAAVSTVAGVVGTPTDIANLARLLQIADSASAILPKGTYHGPDGPYLAGTFGFAVDPAAGTAEYPTQVELPNPPPLPSCPGGTGPAAGPGDSAAAGGAAEGESTSSPSTVPDSQTGRPSGDAAGPSSPPATRAGGSKLVWWLAGLAAVMAALVALTGKGKQLLPLRHRRRPRTEDKD
jgi:phospholipid/cholesterol/gamma-HCH transport system substrate-binding protein